MVAVDTQSVGFAVPHKIQSDISGIIGPTGECQEYCGLEYYHFKHAAILPPNYSPQKYTP
jgi:hypothetical protein